MKIFLSISLLTTFFLAQGQEKDSLALEDTTKISKIVLKDTLYRANYPEGIYKTKEDFINKKVSSTEKVKMLGHAKRYLKDGTHSTYFHYSENNKKVKNVFAISYKGHLYFQIKAIQKNRQKKDRAQSTNYHNMFVRIIMGGDNYLYTEANLVNKWAYGFASNGPGGYYAAENLIELKGIVWDIKNEEFNIFKSCKDYNRFIINKVPKDIQKCKEHQPNIFEVRKTIEKIK